MKRVYLSPPDLNGREAELLLKALQSNWITTLGPEVEGFEREMSEFLSMPHALAVSSGTAALHLALLSLGVGPGDTVLCSDLTFAASAFPIKYCGAHPVFIDSDLATWNMDSAELEQALSDMAKLGELPKAVVVVDIYGQPANHRVIADVCARYLVPIIEDAAEALGATCDGKACGGFGEMGILSFNGNKIITTSGGGMLLSYNESYVAQAKHQATQARDAFPYYQHSDVGYNYRMSNLLAAVGRAQLEGLSQKVERRREINSLYRQFLSEIPGIKFMPIVPYGKPTCWLTCITIEPTHFGATHEDIRLRLEEHNIESRHLWKPMHLQPVFAKCKVYGGSVSGDLFAHGLCLPSGSSMSDADVERICELMASFHQEKVAHGMNQPADRQALSSSIDRCVGRTTGR